MVILRCKPAGAIPAVTARCNPDRDSAAQPRARQRGVIPPVTTRREVKGLAVFLALALFACAAGSAEPVPERGEAPSVPLSRWQPALFRWQYNPAHAPSWLSADEAQAMVERAVNGWRVCAVEIRFDGLTERVPGVMDGTNVIGWAPNLAVAQRGVTTGRTRHDGTLLERDVVAACAERYGIRLP